MKYINNVLDHPKRETIEQRLEIIKFFDDYGAEATKRAFDKSRSTIFLWKQKLKKSGGKLSALAPGDKTPIRKRKRLVQPFILDFILRYRADHPGVDKTTITPVLAVACQRAVIKPVSESTVGRIIYDLKEKGRLPKSTKITINGRTGKLMVREPKLRKKKARRRGFCPQKPGDLIQMDTISIFTDGLKRYIFTAIDVNTRFAFAYAYKSNSSACGSDFLAKFLKVTPFATRRVQTDNGSEFAKHFEQCCQKLGWLKTAFMNIGHLTLLRNALPTGQFFGNGSYMVALKSGHSQFVLTGQTAAITGGNRTGTVGAASTYLIQCKLTGLGIG